jgi:hypothetical protein
MAYDCNTTPNNWQRLNLKNIAINGEQRVAMVKNDADKTKKEVDELLKLLELLDETNALLVKKVHTQEKQIQKLRVILDLQRKPRPLH